MNVVGIIFSGEEKMDEEELVDQTIERLILDGALEIGGVDVENGEILYNFTDKLKDVMPELYNEHLNFVNAEIMYLWERGFISIEDFSEENPRVMVTDKAFNDEEISHLPKDRQRSLEEIKRILKVV
jgi:hypothetical protein